MERGIYKKLLHGCRGDGHEEAQYFQSGYSGLFGSFELELGAVSFRSA
jgi:hypothetical protein